MSIAAGFRRGLSARPLFDLGGPSERDKLAAEAQLIQNDINDLKYRDGLRQEEKDLAVENNDRLNMLLKNRDGTSRSAIETQKFLRKSENRKLLEPFAARGEIDVDLAMSTNFEGPNASEMRAARDAEQEKALKLLKGQLNLAFGQDMDGIKADLGAQQRAAQHNRRQGLGMLAGLAGTLEDNTPNGVVSTSTTKTDATGLGAAGGAVVEEPPVEGEPLPQGEAQDGPIEGVEPRKTGLGDDGMETITLSDGTVVDPRDPNLATKLLNRYAKEPGLTDAEKQAKAEQAVAELQERMPEGSIPARALGSAIRDVVDLGKGVAEVAVEGAKAKVEQIKYLSDEVAKGYMDKASNPTEAALVSTMHEEPAPETGPQRQGAIDNLIAEGADTEAAIMAVNEAYKPSNIGLFQNPETAQVASQSVDVVVASADMDVKEAAKVLTEYAGSLQNAPMGDDMLSFMGSMFLKSRSPQEAAQVIKNMEEFGIGEEAVRTLTVGLNFLNDRANAASRLRVAGLNKESAKLKSSAKYAEEYAERLEATAKAVNKDSDELTDVATAAIDQAKKSEFYSADEASQMQRKTNDMVGIYRKMLQNQVKDSPAPTWMIQQMPEMKEVFGRVMETFINDKWAINGRAFANLMVNAQLTGQPVMFADPKIQAVMGNPEIMNRETPFTAPMMKIAQHQYAQDPEGFDLTKFLVEAQGYSAEQLATAARTVDQQTALEKHRRSQGG